MILLFGMTCTCAQLWMTVQTILTVLTQMILPQEIPPAGIPEVLAEPKTLPRGILPQGILQRGILPRGILPRGILQRGILPQEIKSSALNCNLLAMEKSGSPTPDQDLSPSTFATLVSSSGEVSIADASQVDTGVEQCPSASVS